MDILDNEQRETELLLKKYAKIITTTRIAILVVTATLFLYDFRDYWIWQLHDVSLRREMIWVTVALAINILSYKKPITAFVILLAPTIFCSLGFLVLRAYYIIKIGHNSMHYSLGKIVIILIWWPLLLLLIRGIIAAQKRRTLKKQIAA